MACVTETAAKPPPTAAAAAIQRTASGRSTPEPGQIKGEPVDEKLAAENGRKRAEETGASATQRRLENGAAGVGRASCSCRAVQSSRILPRHSVPCSASWDEGRGNIGGRCAGSGGRREVQHGARSQIGSCCGWRQACAGRNQQGALACSCLTESLSLQPHRHVFGCLFGLLLCVKRCAERRSFLCALPL